MNTLRHVDDRLLLAVNAFARATGWLHPRVLGYARYGVVLFASRPGATGRPVAADAAAAEIGYPR